MLPSRKLTTKVRVRFPHFFLSKLIGWKNGLILYFIIIIVCVLIIFSGFYETSVTIEHLTASKIFSNELPREAILLGLDHSSKRENIPPKNLVTNLYRPFDPPDDVFQDRIKDRWQVEEMIYQTRDAFSDIAEHDDLSDFFFLLYSIYFDINNNILKRESITYSIMSTFVILSAGAFGYRIMSFMIDKMKNHNNISNNHFIDRIIEQITILQAYFVLIPKSRFTEIQQATGINEKHLRALLQLGPFSHEPGCFWRFAEYHDDRDVSVLPYKEIYLSQKDHLLIENKNLLLNELHEHNKELLNTKQRRLHILEEQRAHYGQYCPPHIIMEIEDLQNEINDLKERLL